VDGKTRNGVPDLFLQGHNLACPVFRYYRLESVILPIEEYETLQEVYDLVEHMEIYKLVKEREKTGIDEFIPFEDILKENE